MPKEKQPTATTEANRSFSTRSDLQCGNCTANLADFGWRLKPGQAVHHCDGSPCAYGAKQLPPHHTLAPWPNCWKCRQPLGCPKCVTNTQTEIFCESCFAWGTRAAFLHHGPVPNDPQVLRKRLGRHAPQAEDYPHAWLASYAHGETDFYQDLGQPVNEQGRKMLDVFSAVIPERYAASILRAWEEKPPFQNMQDEKK